MAGQEVVRMVGITKKFGHLIANNGIDFSLKKGEVHTLLGENGAGKTTLLNILYGLVSPDAGDIYINGRKRVLKSPKEAIRSGIGMVHQHFMLISDFTVAENVALCLEANHKFVTPINEVKRIIDKVCSQYFLNIDSKAIVGQLPAQDQQLVEILKILCLEQEILIFDEPTSLLATHQIETFLQRIKKWAAMGHSIIFISHKIEEVLSVSDRITVLRQGKVAGCVDGKTCNKNELVKMMVGRDITNTAKTPIATTREEVLRIENLSAVNERNIKVADDISLAISKGEILGIAGIMGNGQEALVDLIAGTNYDARKITNGEIYLDRKKITGYSAATMVRKGLDIGFVPAKSGDMGIAASMSVTENSIVRGYSRFCKSMILQWSDVDQYTSNLVEEYKIAVSLNSLPAGLLSGGNKTKLILARELSRKPRLMVIFEPTLGLDIGAVEFFKQKLLEAREYAGILVVSSELDFLLSLSDRLAVMFRGKLEEVHGTITKEKLGRMMTGGE